MHSRPVRIAMIVVGVLALLVGALWVGQGLNLIGGSAMTGERVWIYIGAAVAAGGVVLLVLGLRRRHTTAGPLRS
ncbi:hypothetical protein FOE78_22950 [Microlunatus elymi]|uniref:LPXTG-motif cell wall anchor domain-containing protein n=1 Tax=Microlunatus elymi TaxID=2596828 RepID=A0A516Q4K6_9ACTN|nr:hypothetical protein [Microlunatus elymi]QDP98380.1 hypothetical protein FOE78_22950 [Microlunatus elymi]